MLSYADVVGVNDMENGVNAIIQIINNDLTTTSKKIDPLVANRKLELVEEFATLASECYMRNKNERAWIRINIRIIELQLDVRQKILFQCQADESAPPSLPDLSYFSNKLQKLVEWCELAPGVNNPKRESFLLDVIALKMKLLVSYSNSSAMADSLNDFMTGPNGLRRLISRARGMQSTVPHPRTLGTIHECDGRVMLFEHDWPNAKKEFFHAFKNYDESGSDRRVLCLRYIVLAALLENTIVSPFETPETKSLVTNKDIIPVVALWNAFERMDVDDFEKATKDAYANDDFANSFLPVVKRSFQLQKISTIVNAYSKVKIQFIANELKIDPAECESLISEFILDGQLNGSIDQVHGILIMNEEGASDPSLKYNALTQWSRHVEEVTTAISRKVVKEEF